MSWSRPPQYPCPCFVLLLLLFLVSQSPPPLCFVLVTPPIPPSSSLLTFVCHRPSSHSVSPFILCLPMHHASRQGVEPLVQYFTDRAWYSNPFSHIYMPPMLLCFRPGFWFNVKHADLPIIVTHFACFCTGVVVVGCGCLFLYCCVLCRHRFSLLFS